MCDVFHSTLQDLWSYRVSRSSAVYELVDALQHLASRLSGVLYPTSFYLCQTWSSMQKLIINKSPAYYHPTLLLLRHCPTGLQPAPATQSFALLSSQITLQLPNQREIMLFFRWVYFCRDNSEFRLTRHLLNLLLDQWCFALTLCAFETHCFPKI